MILQRLFYVIMLVSGIGMLVIMEFPMKYVVKGIAAIVLIGIMEVIVGRKAKNKKVGWLWAVFAAAILIIILIGYGVLQF
ncbi:hypothetical protein J2Z66_001541 [Paenibacillus eucommiae]|uniref:DUF3953 domain-containing protein n=1 Tax=Paenibacillus eucommiae TaxID=1355755 RepID=A0ABS4IQU1_9BACL|nr:hypothetical protein [Paenibacillus eucommiae]